jgi:hypothetical protein
VKALSWFATGGGPVVRSAMVVILSYLRAGRVSSDLRPIAAIADASGILDAGSRLRRGFVIPAAETLAKAASRGAMAEHDSAISRLRSPRVCMNLVPQSWREQGMPGARCTRGLVCNSAQRNAHEHTGTDGTLRHSLRKGAYGRRKCRQINAVRLLCSHLCRYPMLIGLRRETWGYVDAYRAL